MSHPENPIIMPSSSGAWPALPLEAWQDTYTTLHLWTQIVGKIRMQLTPLVNHWWNTTLYLTPRGLTTSPIPYQNEAFEIIFDFIDHKLLIETSRGERWKTDLKPRSVADFYRAVLSALLSLGIDAPISTIPEELEERIPFELDEKHVAYDPEYAARFWHALLQIDRVFKKFRSGFIGKASPVQFFWGAFDLAVTRFSGRKAPPHPGVPNVAQSVMLEAYSHEVSSCGFWPGAGLGEPAFYAYAYPEPVSFDSYKVFPNEAYYHKELREFILPYDSVCHAADPDATILSFLQSTYEASANLAKWDRDALER